MAGLPGAVRPIPAAPPGVLGLLAVGGLWLILWRGAWRYLGAPVMGAGMLLWALAPARPDILIAPGAKLIGVMQTDGRALDHPTAQGFAARTWLRRDGDLSTPALAAERARFQRRSGRLDADLADGWRLTVIWARNPDPAVLASACQPRTVLVARHGGARPGACTYLGEDDLATGALAIRLGADVAEVIPSRDPRQRRLWTP